MTKDLSTYNYLYFMGIGGIGMSALARYFHVKGYVIAGYDRTPSAITEALQKDMVSILFEDKVERLPEWAMDKQHTLVVYTPAVPKDNALMAFFEQEGYTMVKRAELLGMVTRKMRALCVAGTHGKTTTSTMLAHLLYQSEIGTNAFLGGISRNYGSNLLLQPESSLVVVEADEFDRSFHQLSPTMAVITSADPDHLDIYGTPEAYRESFEHFTSLIRKGGLLLIKQGVPVTPRVQEGVKVRTYGVVENMETAAHLPDFYAYHIEVTDGKIYFDFHSPQGDIVHLKLGVPVWVNIENAVAALAIAWLNGVTEKELRLGIASFGGCQRRFNILLNTPRVAVVDDYAHHPEELRASIRSVRRLYPQRVLVGVFQPHLYSRTQDLQDGFAAALSELDNVVLLPIYPARELPIPGVSSALILDKLTAPHKALCEKAELVDKLVAMVEAHENDSFVVLMLGAGDIDQLVPHVVHAMQTLSQN